MQHLFTLILLCGILAAPAIAQSVVVIGKDGKITSFDAKDVREIIFEEKEEIEPLLFTAVSAEAYGKEAVLVFSGEDGVSVSLDVYTGDATYLKAGTYEVAGSGTAYIGTDPGYTFVQNGTDKLTIKEGTMTVSNERNDYTISIDLILSDDSELKGEYKGEMTDFCQYKTFVSTAAKQVEINDAVPGEIYLKLNDDAWKYEMVLDFFVDPASKTLPSSVYDLKEEPAAPCYGSKSEVSFYSPINTVIKITVPVTVESNGADTSISFELTGPDGAVYTMDYDGEIQYLASEENESYVYPVLNVSSYTKNCGLEFMGEDMPTVVLDVYTDDADYLKDGTYEVGAEAGLRIDASNPTWTYVKKGEADVEITEGSMNVSHEKAEYTITFDFKLSDGTDLKGEYKGALNGYSQCRSYTMVNARQVEVNDMEPGEIYLRLNEPDWKFEMILDFFVAPDLKVIPAGVYTLNENNVAPCYGKFSQIDYYSPNSTYKIDVPVRVEEAGENTVITFDYTENGIDYSLRYEGKIEYLDAEAN
ncbi:MAG: hypothetical protein K2H96_03755 [Muribaculaceae bacterium]|nr:hypothetical protein [Muribaculaceae bacterium]